MPDAMRCALLCCAIALRPGVAILAQSPPPPKSAAVAQSSDSPPPHTAHPLPALCCCRRLGHGPPADSLPAEHGGGAGRAVQLQVHRAGQGGRAQADQAAGWVVCLGCFF